MPNDTEIQTNTGAENPLGTKPVGKLILQFSTPSIIALLVSSFYNIVDQLFIGNFVGELGNAATNIAFPLTILTMSIALLFGVGGAAGFNLSMGEGKKDRAPYFFSGCCIAIFLCGIVITVITLVFLTPLLKLFGSPDDVLPYAQTYVSITAYGFPFFMLTSGGCHLIRADGRPRMSMICNLTGAIINIVLDTLFVVVFDMGMAGAAAATIIGQIVAACMVFWCLIHPKTIKLTREHLIPRPEYLKRAASLGMAPCLNQLATMVVQIAMNNSLKHYGGMSIYGESIPIAVVGIITKVNQIFMSVMGGLSQGIQPILSFNYGAKKYRRVSTTYQRMLICCFLVGICAFLLFQIFPRQIVSLFGEGSSELYYEFAVRYFRIYLMLAFVNFLPQVSSIFFTAIGKPLRGTVISLTRQILFFLPLLLIFPLIWGIDGIMYVGPVADALAVTVTAIILIRELRKDQYRRLPSEPAV